MKMFLAAVLASSLSVTQAWAPVHTLTYSQLPKTLEFAEKAWFFPKSIDHHGPRSLPEDQIHRMLPWTHQQHATVRTDDSYYFDGYSGAATMWPSQSHKSRTSLKMTRKMEALDDTDFYYDDMGNLVSWKAPHHQENDYFDGIGNSRTWGAAVPLAENMLLKKMAVPRPKIASLEACQDYYYTQTGDAMCWIQ
jgi:hypothetical protein